jgi:O-antigen ligase
VATLATPTSPAADPEPEARSPRPRQVLLVGATALIVARPLVLGEDPGLLNQPLSEPVGLVLSLLWLVLAVGWAGWRMWAQEGAWRASLVDLALAVVVGLAFLSAAVAAPYKHPAWLIAWEWLIFLIIFGLVRQLAATPEDRRGLLAALLATAVTVSGQALCQYAFVLPRNQELAQNRALLYQTLAEKGVFLQPDDPQEDYWRERLLMNHVYGTFAHPNSLAGFLALLLPAGVGWAIIAWRRYRGSWWPIAAAGCTLLVAVALWLTHSRGAIVSTLLVGVLVAAVRWRHHWLAHPRRVLAGLVGLAVLVGVMVTALRDSGGVVRLARESMEKRLEYWAGTWQMIQDPVHPRHFWIGVGPGNFGRLYPRYMLPDAIEKVQDPHNFALETWACCGVFALVAILAGVALFFWRTRSFWTAADSEPATEKTPGPPRWEFYVGGMIGLVLAFVLRASAGLTPEEIIDEGILSGAFSLLWFAAFALFESIPWPGPTQLLAVVAGVAALLLNLCVSGGLFFPSVAQPLWVMAALALAPVAEVRWVRHWLVLALPLPVAAVACWFYFSTAFLPVMRTNAFLSEAQAREKQWFKSVERGWQASLGPGTSPQERDKATRVAAHYLEDEVIDQLQGAAAADPSDSFARVQLGYWYGRQWRLYEELYATPDAPSRSVPDRDKAVQHAVVNLQNAWHLDPNGLEGYSVAYQIYLAASQMSARPEQKRREDLEQAMHPLRRMVERDPQDAQLNFLLADGLFRLGDSVGARKYAGKARDRDELLVRRGSRGLSDGQRQQVTKWLASPPPG